MPVVGLLIRTPLANDFFEPPTRWVARYGSEEGRNIKLEI